mgnify:CR=1
RQVFIQMQNNADELTSAVARHLNLTPSRTPIDTEQDKTPIKSSYRSKKSLEMWKVWRDDGTCIGSLEQQQQKTFSSMLLLNVYVVFGARVGLWRSL